MPKVTFDGIDDLMLSMKEIADIPDDVKDEMLRAKAAVVVPAMKARAEAMGIRQNIPDGGRMIDSIKAGKPKSTKTGRAVFVYPQGTRTRGNTKTRNAEVAFVAEYGKKKVKPRPFMKEAVEASAEQAEKASLEVYDAFLKSKNL